MEYKQQINFQGGIFDGELFIVPEAGTYIFTMSLGCPAGLETTMVLLQLFVRYQVDCDARALTTTAQVQTVKYIY